MKITLESGYDTEALIGVIKILKVVIGMHGARIQQYTSGPRESNPTNPETME